MKKPTILITVFILIILLSIISFLLFKPFLTGKTIQKSNKSLDNYTYTKAICDEKNYCQDNLIECNGSKIVSVTPITGAAVQFHPTKWKDPREKETVEKLCGF